VLEEDIIGGLGGTSVGYKILTKGEVLYIVCGGAGSNGVYNSTPAARWLQWRRTEYVGWRWIWWLRRRRYSYRISKLCTNRICFVIK